MLKVISVKVKMHQECIVINTMRTSHIPLNFAKVNEKLNISDQTWKLKSNWSHQG
jgi:hypothetical protein